MMKNPVLQTHYRQARVSARPAPRAPRTAGAPVLPSQTPSAPGVAGGAFSVIVQRVEDARGAGGCSVEPAGDAGRLADLQRAASGATDAPMEVAPEVVSAIDGERGGGAALPPNVQRTMGSAFGETDFGAVRVHTGPKAAQLNHTLQAKAFTTGRDVFFRDGAYQPGTPQGDALIAHELTHTIQQGAVAGRESGGRAGQVQRTMAQRNMVQRLSMNDQPFPNLAPTATLRMRKSSGGSGGVYFADDGAESVVVKLDEPQKAFGAQVANKFTAIGTGLRTSNFRILAPGSQGNNAIKGDILSHTTTNTRGDLGNRPVEARLAADGPTDAADADTAVVLMEKMPNVSLDEMAKDPTQYDNIVSVLTNPQVVKGFAKLIIADALMGNGDRFMKDMAPESAVPDIPANITNIFLSPDLQNVLAMDNEAFKSGQLDHGAQDAGKAFKGKMATVRALLNPDICNQLAEVVVCAMLYTQGDVLPPNDGTVPPNYHLTYVPPTGKLGPLHHKMIQGQVRNRMAAILAVELPLAVETITKSMRKQNKTLRGAFNESLSAASGGTGTFKKGQKQVAGKKSVDYNVLRSRAKFLRVAKKERDSSIAETKGMAAALKHLKHKEKKEG